MRRLFGNRLWLACLLGAIPIVGSFLPFEDAPVIAMFVGFALMMLVGFADVAWQLGKDVRWLYRWIRRRLARS